MVSLVVSEVSIILVNHFAEEALLLIHYVAKCWEIHLVLVVVAKAFDALAELLKASHTATQKIPWVNDVAIGTTTLAILEKPMMVPMAAHTEVVVREALLVPVEW